ncbi:MAG: hypothetical protein RJB66_497 [Pseudomonadota bacterium]|jgi:hypothetical protein
MGQIKFNQGKERRSGVLLTTLLTLALQLPALAGANSVRLCVETLQPTAANSSSEDLAPLKQAILETYIDSLSISLMEQGQKDLSNRLKFAKSGLLKDLAQTPWNSQTELLIDLTRRSQVRLQTDSQEQYFVRKAAKHAISYLDLKNAPFFTILHDLRFSSQQDDVQFSFGHSRDSFSRDLAHTNWSGIEFYIANRLGPLSAVLDNLTPADRVILSNISIDSLSPFFGDGDQIARLELPLASYEKEIYWVIHPHQRRTLLITNFGGSFYLQHFEAMVRRRLLKNDGNIPVVRIESPKLYEKKSNQLLQFVVAHSASFADVTAIAIGYTEAVHKQFAPYLHQEINSTGIETQSKLWSANIYKLPNGETLALLKGDVGTHGEVLGRQVEKALTALPKLRKFFFGGSGGSLKSTMPYSLKFPNFVETPNGKIKNLFKDASWNFGHFSVETPLIETPQLLHTKLHQDLGTVDMEVSTLAAILDKHGIELGSAILVTDYPLSRRVFEKVQLGDQDFQAKRQARALYAQAIELSLRGQNELLIQPIEQKNQKNLSTLSKGYLETIRRRVRWPLTPEEERLLEKYENLPWRTVIRVSPGRLHWMLQDQVLLSTKQVTHFYNAPVKPFTPDIEEQMFGAYDYVFAQYGFNLGHPQYGEIVIELKDDVPVKRGWATPFSGWYAKNKTDSPEAALKYLSSRVVNGTDLKELMKLRWIDYIQRLSAPERQSLLDASPEDLMTSCRQLSCDKMEVKIPSFIDLDEIKRVYLPEHLRSAFEDRLKNEGLETINLP